MSRVTAIISALVVAIVCLSWAVNHYRDNAITYKAQRVKNARELKLANAAVPDMQMRQRDVALDAGNTRRNLLIKLKMMLCVMMLPLVVVVYQSDCQSVHDLTASGVDNGLPDWQTPLNGIISPSRRLITMQKQLEGTQRVY